MVTAIGLPLLIVNDRFQSLGSMSVEDLETFIPFMVKCSVKRAGAQVINGVPEWWTSIIKFKFPLKKPSWLSKAGYRKYLSAIVCSCYWYHDAQYLLPFCAKIASRPDSVTLQSNEDNTTSIFNAQNTRPVLRFNNENKYYDKQPKIKKPSRPSRSLLSALLKKPSVIPDIYLCENCDAEFSSHSEMQKHETECYEIIVDDAKINDRVKSGSGFQGGDVCNKNQTDFSGEIEILEHIKPNVDPSVGKNNYFNYLMLKPKNCESMQRLPKLKNGTQSPCRRWLNVDFSFRKNKKVEFSSLFGRKMLENSAKQELMHKIERNFMLNEYYCSTSFTNRSNREPKELGDFKVTCRKPKKRIWTHQYSFSKHQRMSRYMTLKTGLNEPSRKLLKQCKQLQVVLHRLKVAS